jgi:hypothetical protein
VRCTYETKFKATCPADRKVTDVYHATFESEWTLRVESILAEIARATREPALQEDITECLARRLVCKVTTRGKHSDVETTVVSEP